MVKISVIIPIYNVEKYLPSLFDSLKKQILKDIEIILVDDGSIDNSYKLCKSFQKKDSRVKLIYQNNSGVGIARNKGLEIARGKYVYFCYPDDYFDSNLLLENYELAEKTKAELLIFGFTIETIKHKVLTKCVYSSKEYKTNEDFRQNFNDLYNKKLLYSVWTKIYLRDSLRNKRFDDRKIGEDTAFNLNLYQDIDRVTISDKIYYHYIIGRPNSSFSKRNFSQIDYKLKELIDLKNILNKWRLKNSNSKLFIKNQYIDTCMNALELVEFSSQDKNKIKKLTSFMKRNDVQENLKFDKNNSIKQNIKVALIKNYKNRLVLSLHKRYYKFQNRDFKNLFK